MNTQAYRKTPIASIALYQILSFILATIYFVLVVAGLSVGVGTLIIWIGLPILVLTFGMIRGIGAIERSLVREMLGVPIREPRTHTNQSMGIWKRGIALLRDPLSWKSLLYMFINFPLSTLFFCITITLLAVTIGLVLAPLGYLIATYVLQLNGIQLESNNPPILDPITMNITGTFEVFEFIKCFIYSVVGVAFWFLASAILRAQGSFSAAIACALLGSSEQEMDSTAGGYVSDYKNIQPDRYRAYTYGYNTTPAPQQPEQGQDYKNEREYTQPQAVYQEQTQYQG